MKTIVKVLHGSHLYGTNSPNSDTDYKTIYIPEAKSLMLQRALKNTRVTTGKEHQKNTKDDVDSSYIALDEYIKLLSEGQTMALDLLWAPDSNILETSPLWKYIQENRWRLVHRRMLAFVGYCKTQANKYGIKGSRMGSVKTAIDVLNQLDKHSTILAHRNHLKAVFEGVEHIGFVNVDVNLNGVVSPKEYFEVCGRKFEWACKIDYVIDALTKIYDNYGAKAQQAMNNEGIDWKALSHAVRVCTQGIELLKTGKMTLPLPEPALSFVRDIKFGKLPYSQVQNIIENYIALIEKESSVSTLPDEIDKEFCEDLITNSYMLYTMSKFRPTIHNEDVSKWLMED